MGEKRQKLIFVRHGETGWNSSFRFQGQTDVPLGEEGRRQSALLAERLSHVSFDRIYSSPLSRAFETASIISGRVLIPDGIIKMEGLSEMCFGRWEGLAPAEIQEKDPDLFHSWWKDPSSVTPPGGEPFHGLVSRAGAALRTILKDDDENILVVCHGGTIRAALTALLDVPPSAAWKVRVDNCSISIMDVHENWIMLRYMNDTIHLLAAPSPDFVIPVF